MGEGAMAPASPLVNDVDLRQEIVVTSMLNFPHKFLDGHLHQLLSHHWRCSMKCAYVDSPQYPFPKLRPVFSWKRFPKKWDSIYHIKFYDMCMEH